MKLTLLEAPQSEIISLKDAKQYMRINHDCDDNLIDIFIKATREAIEAIIQKSILKQKWLYQIALKEIKPFNDDKDCPHVYNEILHIPLPKPPVINVEAVNLCNPSGRKKTVQDFVLTRQADRFYLQLNWLQFKRAAGVLNIVFHSGIAENSENIPYQIKLANLMLVNNAYKKRFTYDSSDFMPEGIMKLLTGFKSLRIV